MAKVPNNRTYNEFDSDTKSAIEALAIKSARGEKDYIDREIKPFREGRVIILVGQAGNYSGGRLQVTVADADGSPIELQAAGCSPSVAKSLKGKSVRVLFDVRNSTAYYDDQVF